MFKKIFNGKKKVTFYIGIVAVLIVFMTLGTALLSNTLTIIGNSKIKKNSWVIYFDDIDIASDSSPNEDPKDDAMNLKKTLYILMESFIGLKCELSFSLRYMTSMGTSIKGTPMS